MAETEQPGRPSIRSSGRSRSRGLAGPSTGGVEVWWIPLGAGEHVVRVSGRIYEALSAFVQRRERRDLYHSALVVETRTGRFVVEMTPIPRRAGGPDRGVVAEAPVGSRWLAWLRVFRYEIRRWQEGVIPDLAFAVDSPLRLSDDPALASQLLDLVPMVPTPVWGRDELGAGEMWNSNSVTAWLLTEVGLAGGTCGLPLGGRAPGWQAGVFAAGRTPSLVPRAKV